MVFSSIDYIIFFLIILCAMYVLKATEIKKRILLIASYFFYAYWDYRFVFLMAGMSIANYYIGRKIEDHQGPSNRKWLLIGIIINLSILGTFKYYNFFVDTANAIFTRLGVHLPFLDIVIPVGISFITFEVISYVIDIYRGVGRSAKSLGDLALLVAFFPHLIAGPILKPSHFLPQLDAEIKITKRNLEIGVQIFLIGMVKKVLIADRLALFVDPIFHAPYSYDSATIWLAVLAYSIQIYCDFSGYTDMAIGSARCLGFEIPQNFNMPYISRSITEFWRRWHISLSSWLKDYLYIPLGGNRKGRKRQYYNLFVVMLLGGLWHGASWNFVLWGGLHGAALAMHKLYAEHINTWRVQSRAYDLLCWIITYIFVCTAWVFFRASDFGKAWFIVRKMFGLVPSQGISWYFTALLIIIPFLIVSHYTRIKLGNYFVSLSSFKGLIMLFLTILGLLLLMPLNSSPFIYFQF